MGMFLAIFKKSHFAVILQAQVLTCPVQLVWEATFLSYSSKKL